MCWGYVEVNGEAHNRCRGADDLHGLILPFGAGDFGEAGPGVLEANERCLHLGRGAVVGIYPVPGGPVRITLYLPAGNVRVEAV